MKKKTVYIWFSIIMVLMILATIWDYQITNSLSQMDNVITNIFFRFFEIFGEIALTFNLVLITSFFCSFGLRKKNSFVKYIQVTINGLLTILFSFMTFYARVAYMNPENGNSHGSVSQLGVIICIGLGIVLAIIMIKVMTRISSEKYNQYRRIAIAGIIFTLLLMFVINGIKFTWARPRFWYIEAGNATFVPWYIINGNNVSDVTNAYMSFVSGHTANAFAIIYVALWVPKYKDKMINFALIWGLLTGLSRLFAGQHFLSDVTMGGVIVLLLFAVTLRITKVSLLDNSLDEIKK